MSSPQRLVRSVLGWPVETQLGARRNALVASTALAQARRERDDVEEFLAARVGGAGTPVSVPASAEPHRYVI